MILKSQKKNTHHTRGFTLVELMVSLSIFAIVMTVSTGTLLVLVDINAKAQALYSATSNLSFALDSMTRDIRTGHHYYCYTTNSGNVDNNLPAKGTVDDCLNENSIMFTRERDDLQVAYRLNDTNGANRIEYWDEDITEWIPITSPDVTVDTFQITVDGSESYYENLTDEAQPIIDLFIRGHVTNGLETDTQFTVQTRMVGRRLDII